MSTDDDTNDKPVRFKQSYAGAESGTSSGSWCFDVKKNEEKIPLANPDDLYTHSDRLKAMIAIYDGKSRSKNLGPSQSDSARRQFSVRRRRDAPVRMSLRRAADTR
ncbi:MAG: hypothetical protein MJE77_42935 [Proteobacteria bacterium]|nr:hypothetical protein [Pseudomonadota bacterium]